MSVKGHLALLVGVFVVALLGVALVQWNLAGDVGGAVRDLTRSDAPSARAARELRASHLAERRALAGFLLTGGAADAAALQQARRDTQRWRAELAAAGLDATEQAVPAEADRLLADQQAAADRAVERRRSAGPAATRAAAASGPTPACTRPRRAAGTGWWPGRTAGSRPFTPEGQDAAR
jgi:CHASE3 domain sensor protein